MVYEDAARHRKHKYLRYLHENGRPWHRYAYRAVALGGHVGYLEFLRERGCPEGNDDNDNDVTRVK